MTDLVTIRKDKAQTGKGMGFIELLAGYDKATNEHLANTTPHNLAQMPSPDNLCFVTDDLRLSVNATFIPTQNTLAAIVYDEQFKPSGIVFCPTKDTPINPADPNGHRPQLYYTDPDKLQAFMIGSGQGEVITTDTMANAKAVFELVDDFDMKSHTIMTPFDKAHYVGMAINLAKHRPITVTTDFKNEPKQLKAFKDSDIKLVSFATPIADYVERYQSWYSLLTDGLDSGEVHLSNLQAVNIDHARKVISDLAQLDELSYQIKKRTIAKDLGMGVNDLDKVVKQERQGLEVSKITSIIDDVEPHPAHVNGDELAHEILAIIKSHIVCNDAVAVSVTLWIFFTWCIDVCHIAPIAWINAPEKGCGKTQLATLMGRMSRRTIATANISPASLFRCIDRYSPTLVIDEADSFFNNNDDLRGIVNAGFSRDICHLWRCVGDNNEPAPFNVFGAKIISGIGKLPSTVMDRSISITLKRALPHEKRQRVKSLPKATTSTIKAKLARWSDDNMAKVAMSKPNIPESIYNREFDTWEILFQIADTLGGNWLKLVTNACLVISEVDNKEPTEGEELLNDIKAVFELQGVENIATRDLLAALVGADNDGLTKRWATSNKGQPMTDRQLAKRLKGFGVNSKQIRFGEKNLMGYTLESFKDVFSRYLA